MKPTISLTFGRALAVLVFVGAAPISHAQIFDFEPELGGFATAGWNTGSISVSDAWSSTGSNSMRIQIPDGFWHANVATWDGAATPDLRTAVAAALPDRDLYRFVFDLALDQASTTSEISFNVAFQSSTTGFDQHFGVAVWPTSAENTGFAEKTNVYLNLADTNLPMELADGQWFQMTLGSSNTAAVLHVDNIRLEVIPEPSTYALFGGFLALGLAMVIRRRRTRA